MKSISSYLTVIIVAIFFSSCAPPGADGKPASGDMGGNIQYIFLGLMILVFWLFFIRPQAKRAKNQKTFIQNLGKGDKIVTIAGIHGVVNKLNDDGTIMMETSPGSYIKIERSAISMEWTANVNKAAAAATAKK